MHAVTPRAVNILLMVRLALVTACFLPSLVAAAGPRPGLAVSDVQVLHRAQQDEMRPSHPMSTQKNPVAHSLSLVQPVVSVSQAV